MEVVFNNFSGGLNNVLRPCKIGKTQAQVFKNIDLENGTLKPYKKNVLVNIAQDPYQPVYFNQISVDQKIETKEPMVSQWGKYYTKDRIYYVDDNDDIHSSSYSLGNPGTYEFEVKQQPVNFDNYKTLKGTVFFLTEDAAGNLVSDVIIAANEDPITVYEAYRTNAAVVYGIDSNGDLQTGRFKEVIHDKMPYYISTTRYIYSGSRSGYVIGNLSHRFTPRYTPEVYDVIYTKGGAKVTNAQFIAENGNPIDIDVAILYNKKIVIEARKLDDGSDYAEVQHAKGNITADMPFYHEGKRWTFSKEAPTGYQTVHYTKDDIDRKHYSSIVRYDDTDRDPTDYHTYYITFYNHLTGQETPPISSETQYIHPAELGSQFSFESQVLAPGVYDDFTKARIYRVSGPYTTPRFVAELDNIRDADRFKFDFTKYVKNGELGRICPVRDSFPKPRFLGITRHANRIFGYNGNRLYFTVTDSPYSWSEFSTVYVEGHIKGLSSSSAGLLILTKSFKVYLLTGTNPNTFNLKLLADNIGYDEGLVSIKGISYWIYNQDVYISDGTRITNVSINRFKLPKERLVNLNVLNEDIYLVYPSLIYRFHKGALIEIPISGVEYTTIKNGTLVYFKDGAEYQLSTSLADGEFEYTSPDIYMTSLTDVKEFDKVEIVTTGRVDVRLFIDGEQVAQEFMSGEAITNTIVKIPVRYNKGNYLAVNLRGSGEVYEYKVTVVGAQNGR